MSTLLVTVLKLNAQDNMYMCGPLTKKGLVCSECADGFGPSMTSCDTNVPNALMPGSSRYGVPLFLVIECLLFWDR